MYDQFEVPDSSGNKRTFETGAHRDVDDGKPRFDLLSLHGMKRQAAHMLKGAVKHGFRNWEKGWPVSISIASIWRHWLAYLTGDKKEDHLSAMKFNIDAIIHVEEGGNNAELWGKAGLLDNDVIYPQHGTNMNRDETFYKIVLSVASDYQVKLSYYGGTTDELYTHFMSGDTATHSAPTRDTFADALIWLEQNQYLHLEQDGLHTPVWQAAAVGRPFDWGTEPAKDTAPSSGNATVSYNGVILGSDAKCSCGITGACLGTCSDYVPDDDDDNEDERFDVYD